MQVQGETIQFRIPADTKHIAMVRKAIESIASSLGFTKEVADDIELSVAEALTNAIQHGSPDRPENAVVAMCKVTGDRLIIDVRDSGPGFAPPCGEGEIWDEHGRGLRLIYQLMDNVRICRTEKGSKIRMVKEKPCLPEPPRKRSKART